MQRDKNKMPALSNKLILIFALFSFVFTACTGTRSIRPLDKGQQRFDLSLGGPLTKVGGLYVPAPVSSIAYTRGLSSRSDGYVAIHPTAGLFGIAILESGGSYQIGRIGKAIPALMLSPRFFVMTEFESSTWRFYPDIQLHSSWYLKNGWLLYTGASNFYEMRNRRAFGDEQRYHWLFSPLVGTEFKWGKLQFQFEMKWYAANVSNRNIAPDYPGFSESGAIGTIISIKKTW